jgi:hypothetical protein
VEGMGTSQMPFLRLACRAEQALDFGSSCSANFASASRIPRDTFFSSVATLEGCDGQQRLGFHAHPFYRTWELTGLPFSSIGMQSLGR